MPLENPGSSSVSFSSQQTELIQIFAKRTYPPQKLLSLMSISIFDKVTKKMNIIYIQIFLVPKADIFKWVIIILIFFSTKILALHKKFGEIHRKLYNFTFKNGCILKQKCSNSAVKLCVCIPWSWRYCPKFWGTPSTTLKIVNNLNARKIIVISDNNNFSQMLPV